MNSFFNHKKTIPKPPPVSQTLLPIPPPPPFLPTRPLPPNVIPLKNIPGLKFKSAPTSPPSTLFPLIPPPPPIKPKSSKQRPKKSKSIASSRKPKKSKSSAKNPAEKSAKPSSKTDGIPAQKKTVKETEFKTKTVNRIIDCYIDKLPSQHKPIKPPLRTKKRAIPQTQKFNKQLQVVSNLIENSPARENVKLPSLSYTLSKHMGISERNSKSTPSTNHSKEHKFQPELIGKLSGENANKGEPETSMREKGSSLNSLETPNANGFDEERKLRGNTNGSIKSSAVGEMKQSEQKQRETAIRPELTEMPSGRSLRPRKYEYKKPQVGSEFQVDSSMIPSLISSTPKDDNVIDEKASSTISAELKNETHQLDCKALLQKILMDSIVKGIELRSPYVGAKIMWNPHILSPSEVEKYLDQIEGLFPHENAERESKRSRRTGRGFCPQKALYLLHQSEYDVEKALDCAELSKTLMKDAKLPFADSESSNEEKDLFEEDLCFICGDGGNLVLCDFHSCKRVYHANCIDIKKLPEGEWQCPAHSCDICKNETNLALVCINCPIGYCNEHKPQTDSNDESVEFICSNCRKSNLNLGQLFEQRFAELLRRRVESMRCYRVGGKNLDYYTFYKAVISYGGARRVTDELRWSRVKKKLEIPDSSTNASSLLKSIYMKMLFAYEQSYFPNSLPMNYWPKERRGKIKNKATTQADYQSSETCDIIVTGFQNHCLKIEANINGTIKHGFLFLPSIVRKNLTSLDQSGKNGMSEQVTPFNREKIKKELKSRVDADFYRSVNELADEISTQGGVENPNFELALETRFALKKTAISHNSLAKILKIEKDELNVLLRGGKETNCSETAKDQVKNWLKTLSSSVVSNVRSAVENFKFKEMTKLENLKLKRRKAEEVDVEFPMLKRRKEKAQTE